MHLWQTQSLAEMHPTSVTLKKNVLAIPKIVQLMGSLHKELLAVLPLEIVTKSMFVVETVVLVLTPRKLHQQLAEVLAEVATLQKLVMDQPMIVL